MTSSRSVHNCPLMEIISVLPEKHEVKRTCNDMRRSGHAGTDQGTKV